MKRVISSDILESQFGPTNIEVIKQDNNSRLIYTKVIATGQILEVSKVQFKTPVLSQFFVIHQEIMTGKSIGKSFRKHNVDFIRQQKSVHKKFIPAYDAFFGDNRPATVVEVSIFVGPEKVHYADILEIYSPDVQWPMLDNVLIIDNYDSFTNNLYQQIAGLGHKVQIAKHDAISLEEIEMLAPSHIIISPGPKRPANSGISLKVIKQFHQSTPIFGVCLGHQCIGEVFGSITVPAVRIMHGKTDMIHNDSSSLFSGTPEAFLVTRYHSLVVDKLPPDFKLTAWSDDGSIMAMQHKTHPLYSVQFHPESFMTDHGTTIIRNFFNATA